jgi:hypothetical protein
MYFNSQLKNRDVFVTPQFEPNCATPIPSFAGCMTTERFDTRGREESFLMTRAEWWRCWSFCQFFPRSFFDSNAERQPRLAVVRWISLQISCRSLPAAAYAATNYRLRSIGAVTGFQ